MLIGAIVLASFVLAGLLHARPAAMVAIALAGWIFIPGVAIGMYTGRSTGLLGFHPVTWFVLACLLVLLVRHPAWILTEIAGRCLTYLALFAVCAAAAIMTLMGTKPPGWVIVVDQMIIPITMFAIASTAFRIDDRAKDVIRNWVVGLAVVQSVLAIAQWTLGSILVYGSQFAVNYWFTPLWDRWMGTTDHPLVLSMVICAAVPMVAGLARSWQQIGALVLLATATVITQSRTAIVLVPLCLIYVIVRSRSGPGMKVVIGGAVVGGAIALLASPLVAGIQSRLQDDTGSSEARGRALDFFLERWSDFTFYGDGITTSFQVARVGGLSTSLESAYLMYAVGIGVLATTAYFGLQVSLILRSLRRPAVRGAWLSGIMVFVIPQTFSSLGVNTVCGPLLWVVLALAMAGRVTPFGADNPRDKNPDAREMATTESATEVDSLGQGAETSSPITTMTSALPPVRSGG